MSRGTSSSRPRHVRKASTALTVIEALEDAQERSPHLKNNQLFQSLMQDAIFEFASSWDDNVTPNEWRSKR